MAALFLKGTEQRRKFYNIPRTKKQIYVGTPFEEEATLLLCQTAADTDGEAGLCLLQLFQLTQSCKDLLRSFFPDAARVHQNQIRAALLCSPLITQLG